MTKHLQTHHRVIGSLLGGSLALSITTAIPYFPYAVPVVALAAAFGATRAAQRLARPAIALAGGLTVGFIAYALLLGPLGHVLMALSTIVLYVMIGDLGDADEGALATES